jgi:hypothetical protein
LKIFWGFINLRKDEEVVEKFNVPKVVIEEIRKMVSNYFGEWQEFKLISIERISESKVHMPMFEVFQMNQPEDYGVECVLFDAKGEETGLIFHAVFTPTINGPKMNFHYIR